MRAYMSAFKLRLKLETQYRAAALGGLICQVFFGVVLIALYTALYETRGQATALSSVVTYVWLQQACFRMLLSTDDELKSTIIEGGMAYNLCRPVSPYFYWYARSFAQKIMGGILRAVPMMLIALFLMPEGYRLGAPASPAMLLLFFLSLFLGLWCVSALDNIAAGFTIRSLDPRGVSALLSLLMMTFSGNILPLTLFPDSWQTALRLTPYAQLLDTPIRLYTGALPEGDIPGSLLIQCFWAAALILFGVLLWQRNLRRVVVQGG